MKQRPPKIDLTDEDIGLSPEGMKAMSREELDRTPYDLKKWCCQVKSCSNGTKIRDYGIVPLYFLHRKHGFWVDLKTTFFLCGKHWKWFHKLKGLYGGDATEKRLLDRTVMPTGKVTSIKEKVKTKSAEKLESQNLKSTFLKNNFYL